MFHVKQLSASPPTRRCCGQWQKAVNLVAPGTLDAVWHRHFADSAQLLPLAPPGPRHWIDLGSGAGFPGLVSRSCWRSPSPSPPCGGGTGEGRRQRHQPPTSPSSKATPARPPSCARSFAQTGLSAGNSAAVAVEILSIRAESVRIKVNVFVATGCLRARPGAARQAFGVGGALIPARDHRANVQGKRVSPRSCEAAEKTWNFNVELVPSVTDRDGRIAVITNLERKAKD